MWLFGGFIRVIRVSTQVFYPRDLADQGFGCFYLLSFYLGCVYLVSDRLERVVLLFYDPYLIDPSLLACLYIC
ncbi:hypothetical protein, partial [Tropheryma whipplei]|uniref:hypothetical protein n=1 Tax=Tropheryma whipplei TaxID=2039 RepID=UPI00056E3A24